MNKNERRTLIVGSNFLLTGATIVLVCQHGPNIGIFRGRILQMITINEKGVSNYQLTSIAVMNLQEINRRLLVVQKNYTESCRVKMTEARTHLFSSSFSTEFYDISALLKKHHISFI